MPKRLRDLRVKRVDYVDAGADPHARIRLHKRDENREDVEKQGPVRGSYEALQDELREALRARWGDQFPMIEATFNDRVIVTVDEPPPPPSLGGEESPGPIGTRTYEVDWDRDENGNVTLGESREVELTTTIRGVTKRDDTVNRDKEERMPVSEEVRKNLSQEVVDELERLETENQELKQKVEGPKQEEEEEPEQDLAKREDLPDDVREALAKRDEELASLREQVEKSDETIRKEREERELEAWKEKVAKLNALQVEDRESLAKRLQGLDDESAEELYKTLSAANAQAESGALFEELGGGGSAPTDAEQELEQVAKSKREADASISEAKSFELAMEERPDLYKRTLTERG